jgi:hypothetical protein
MSRIFDTMIHVTCRPRRPSTETASKGAHHPPGTPSEPKAPLSLALGPGLHPTGSAHPPPCDRTWSAPRARLRDEQTPLLQSKRLAPGAFRNGCAEGLEEYRIPGQGRPDVKVPAGAGRNHSGGATLAEDASSTEASARSGHPVTGAVEGVSGKPVGIVEEMATDGVASVVEGAGGLRAGVSSAPQYRPRRRSALVRTPSDAYQDNDSSPVVDRISAPVHDGAAVLTLTGSFPVREGGLEPPPSNTRTSTSS